MTLAERLLIGVASAAGVAYLLTPYVIALALRIEFVDRPAGYKGHAQATPYLGGAAVLAAFAVAVLAAAGDYGRTPPLLLGASILWAVGTLDDRRSVSAGLRVVVELALAAGVWGAGLGWHLHAGGGLDLALTCAWVVAVVNAFNLFDNMDGAAGTIVVVTSAGIAGVGLVRGDAWLAAAAASLAGACLGFLPRNLSVPSKIFLGDGGSMPAGFAVAVLAMVAAGTSSVAWRSLLVAVLLVGVPVLDTSLVIVSRRRRGVSVLTGGRDHLTHRARRILPSARAVAVVLGLLQAALSLVAVLTSNGQASVAVISTSAYLLLAGTAIVLMDTQPIEEFAVAREGPDRIAALTSKRAPTCLVAIGLGAGLSPFLFAYYDAGVWAPVGLGLTLVCAVGVVLAPFRPGAPGVLCLAGTLGLGGLSLVSSLWAESVESAVVSGDRWLVYGVLLLLVLVLVSHDRRAAILAGAAGVGIGAVALSVLARLLGGDPGAMFLGGRLNAPLGYINGEGCLFAMGIWPCVALIESRRVAVASLGVAGGVLMACLALLSQSRGTALAMAGALALVLVLVPGRTRRAYALLLIAAALAAASSALLHVYSSAAGGPVSPGAAHAAGWAALVAAVGGGAAWALLSSARSALAARGRGPALSRLGARLLVLPVVLVLGAGVVSAHRVERDLSAQWHAFVRVSETGEASAPSASHSRLLAGAGNRYDYWRIAWSEFAAHPLLGLGAGNFARPYFQRRSTTEDVEQPHSIELQTLAELGLLGALLLGCLVAGVGWGAVRMSRRAGPSSLRRGLCVSGVGLFGAWFVQTSVDWMHLLPGLSAIALAGAAVLVWPRASAREAPARARARPPLGRRLALGLSIAAVAVTLVAAGASLSRQTLAQVFAARARREIASGRPAAALRDAERSLGMDADATATYYLKAAVLARFGEAAPVQATLASALALEPRNFVTWTLLGDVAERRRDYARAHADYVHAHLLNPRNRAIAILAGRPARPPG